jgi:hypothetical protein
LVARGDRGERPAFGDFEQSTAQFGEVGVVGAKRAGLDQNAELVHSGFGVGADS